MKKYTLNTFILLLLTSFMVQAQAPQKMSYQAVMRDANDALLSNSNIGIKISILAGGVNGTEVYAETQSAFTNVNGLLSLIIGNGTVLNGDIATIDWGNDTYYIETEIDPNGGSNYSISGTNQLLSVPYALYANESSSSIPGPQGIQGDPGPQGPQGPISATAAGNNIVVSGTGTVGDPYIIEAVINEADGDSTNEIQDLQLLGNNLTITNNGTATTIDLSPYLDNTDTQLTEAQVDAFVSDNGFLTTEVDGSITNEIQDLQLSGNNLTITNNGTATTIDLSPYLDNTDTQLTEAQVDAFVSDNGFLTTEVDGSITNEIQDLQLSGNNLTITNNGTATTIDLSPYLDNTDTQLTEAQVDAFVNNNGYLTTEVDGSVTNEIQTLTRNGDSISLSDGGTISILDGDTTHWKENINGIHNENDWVGIGVDLPFYKIHVEDDLEISNGIGIFANLIGGSTSGNFYRGIFSEINGTDGNNRGMQGNSYGNSVGSNQGLSGFADSSSTSNYGVLGVATGSSPSNYGVFAITNGTGSFNTGLLGVSTGNGDVNKGIEGQATAIGGAGTQINIGVLGQANNNSLSNVGVYGLTNGTTANDFAGFFDGNVTITGNLDVNGNISKGGGTFKIDHPLYPEEKYLVHSFVESPEMLNVYSGNITTDLNGEAVVSMPEYFEASNKEYRYQLTVIGSFANAIISKEIAGNKFVIASDQPQIKVSWQVTAVRADKYADANRIVPELDKTNKGTYLHPELYGVSDEKDENYKQTRDFASPTPAANSPAISPGDKNK